MLMFYQKGRAWLVWRALGALLLLLLAIPFVTGCSNGPEFTTLDLGIPSDALKSPVKSELAGNTQLHVRVTFKVNQDWLKKAEQQPIEPSKPSKVESLANKIGIDDGTYQKIKDFFSLQGLSLKLGKLRTHLAVDGKASTFAKIFQTKFVVHDYKQHTFYAPDVNQPAKLPNFLTNWIEVITGLDDYSSKPRHDFTFSPTQPAQLASTTTAQRSAQGNDCSPDENTLFPKDVATAYGHTKLWDRGWHGENMTVNLVEIDGSYRDDVQNYLNCIDFQGKFEVINVGSKPNDALGESTLDIEMVAGLARSAHIKVYQTDGNADGDVWVLVNDMLQRLIDDNVNNANSGNTVSISLGASEGEISSNDVRAINSSLEQLTRVEHMTVFVASGDCGAFTSREYGDLSVAYPASDPWVTAVGGTILQIDRAQNRAKEQAWSDGSRGGECKNQWGSGGGISQIFKMPNWQNANGVRNQYSKGNRQVPDVSAAAYGLAVYFEGRWGNVGGTSAAAPIWAAGQALVNQGLLQQKHTFAFGPQQFYQINNSAGGSHPYYDVTDGDNLYYKADPGWDYPTGLGTPNFNDLYTVTSNILK